MPLINSLDLSPKAAGHPKLSIFTIAMRSPSFSKTMALAVKSPFLIWAGFGVPTPPETAINGSGVIMREAAPTFNSCAGK